MLNVISTCREILCVDINVDKRCVDHSTIDKIMVNGSQLAKNLKSIFLTCPCHKIYRVEAVGLKSSNYIFKNGIFVKFEIWGNFVKI